MNIHQKTEETTPNDPFARLEPVLLWRFEVDLNFSSQFQSLRLYSLQKIKCPTWPGPSEQARKKTESQNPEAKRRTKRKSWEGPEREGSPQAGCPKVEGSWQQKQSPVDLNLARRANLRIWGCELAHIWSTFLQFLPERRELQEARED